MDEELQEKFDEVKKHLTITNVARTTTKFVVRHSVSFVAATLAKTYCPTENKKQQLQVTVGAYVIGGMAADSAVDWAEHKFDEYAKFVHEVVTKFKDKSKTEEAKVWKEATQEPVLTSTD